MATFAGKEFNAEVFQKYMDRVPNTKRTELLKSNAITRRPDLAAAMKDQVGGNIITTPLKGLATGTKPSNYDGNTNIAKESTISFKHTRVVVGRSKGWEEADFTFDITGEDFMANIAAQVSKYWEEEDQDTIINILAGIFAMTGAGNATFVRRHTYDVTGITNTENQVGKMDGTTLNKAIQRACGDNKSIFSVAIMHSEVSTNLENMKLLVYMKYNDAQGIEKDLTIGTLNGRLVLIDDGMPVSITYAATSDQALDPNKAYYTRSGSSSNYVYTEVASPAVGSIDSYYEESNVVYTTYVLGRGAIEFTDCGAKVPYEVDRDPAIKGGVNMLYTRQRKCWAPYGISWTSQSMASNSPTDAELATGSNWALVSQTVNSKTVYFDHKAIPIARIKSLG